MAEPLEEEPNEAENNRTIVSKQIILQLAVRALRRVHFDAQLFSIGQFDEPANQELIKRINTGTGIEVALETSVRDALAQEFNTSKLAHGWKIRGEGDRWFGVIDREVKYKVHGDSKSALVDLEYRRVADRTNPDPEKAGKHYPLGPLELKRAEWAKPDLITGEPPVGRTQLDVVVDDIRKLARFARAAAVGKLETPDVSNIGGGKSGRKLHPHILVWGIRNEPHDDVIQHDPETFMKAAFDDAKICGCTERNREDEWFPVCWDATTRNVTRWVWLSLAEINVNGTECDDPECPCRVDRPKPEPASTTT